MGHDERAFENILAFEVSKDGKVRRSPLSDIQSTSPGQLQQILLEITPQVAEYIEKLLAQKKFKGKWNTIEWE